MFNELGSLTGRPAVVDTNVWINACLSPESTAWTALQSASCLGFKTVIDTEIYDEAKKVLRKSANAIGIRSDITWMFEAWLQANGINVLPAPNGQYEFGRVNKWDLHIARAAVAHAGWVVTGDAKLMRELLDEGIDARSPWDVVNAGNPGRLKNCFRALRLGYEEGSIFIRCSPLDRCRSDRSQTLLDVQNLGRIYYRGPDKSWAFELPDKTTVVSVAAKELHQHETAIILVNYKRGDNAYAEIRLGSSGGRNKAPAAYPHADNAGTVQFFPGFVGHIQVLVGSEKRVSRRRWRVLRSLPNAAPDPFDETAAARLLLNRLRLLIGPSWRDAPSQAQNPPP